MNYIYFNPREWSSEQAQCNTQYQNGNGFYQFGSNRQVSVERSFINDFDGSLVESLMFGGWNEPYVKVGSRHFSLLPNTEYCFVFWLNGGENDKNNEICQLQITFFDNPGDCCTYKLNRNYIKPLLHRQGWELYSIPFVTPDVEQGVIGSEQVSASPVGAEQGGFATASVVDTRFSFVSGNAPMAVKPAKEPSFYAEWEDEPDEFAKWRPQRHNLVFEDGWPAINMYGGDKYSTEVLRKKEEQGVSGQKSAPKQEGSRHPFVQPFHDLYFGQHGEQYRQMMQGVAENVQQKAQGLAANAKQMAKGLAQNTRQMAEYYRESVEQRKNQSERRAELAELLSEFREKQTELNTRQEELSERRHDLQTRYKELQSSYCVDEEEKTKLDTGFDETTEWTSSFSALLALDAQFSCASDMVSNQNLPIEAAEGLLDGIENQLDSVEEMCDNSEEILDELEELLDKIEDEAAEAEED